MIDAILVFLAVQSACVLMCNVEHLLFGKKGDIIR